jgi:hypothetical protein
MGRASRSPRAANCSTSTASSMCVHPDGCQSFQFSRERRGTPCRLALPVDGPFGSHDIPSCTSNDRTAGARATCGRFRTRRATKPRAAPVISYARGTSCISVAPVCRSARGADDSSYNLLGSKHAKRPFCSHGNWCTRRRAHSSRRNAARGTTGKRGARPAPCSTP